MQILKRILGVLCISFLALSVSAQTPLPPPRYTQIPSPFPHNYEFFYWPSRISAWGLGGDRGVGMADGMVPLLGNDSAMFYADAQGAYASSQNWFGGVALGLREIFQGNEIIGGYVFFDRNEFNNSGNASNSIFYVVSPGLESMGNIWDFRVNGYFPVSSQRDSVGSIFADEAGNFNFVEFQGHQQLDHVLDIFNSIGPGVDAEIGREVPGLPNTRVFLGGYYFDPKNTSSIEGVEARINYPVSHFLAFTAADSYDNTFKNSFEAGVKLTLGGLPTDVSQYDRDISRRMLDPISRNLGALSRGTAQPVVRTTKDEGNSVVERDNIYFFTSTGGTPFDAALGTQNCTFENPCTGASFEQATVSSIAGFAPNANFYFDPGTYDLDGQLSLFFGQSMFGRIVGYTQPASGSGRPIFTGGLELLGNNTLDSFQLLNDGGSQTVGITASNTSNILINNLQVGSLDNSGTAYPTGISLTSVFNFSATNSVIDGFDTDINGVVTARAINATGGSISLTGDSLAAEAIGNSGGALLSVEATALNVSGTSLSINGSSITAETAVNGAANPDSGTATGINGGNNSIISVANSSIDATETFNTGTGPLAGAADIILGSGNQLTVTNSSLDSSLTATSGSVVLATSFGVRVDGNNNSLNVSGSSFSNSSSATSVDATNATAESIVLVGTGNTLSADNNSFNASATSNSPPGINTTALAVGIGMGTGNSATVTNNNFTVSSSATGDTGTSTAYGIDNSGAGNTLVQSGNTFNVNAVGTPGIVVTEADINP